MSVDIEHNLIKLQVKIMTTQIKTAEVQQAKYTSRLVLINNVHTWLLRNPYEH